MNQAPTAEPLSGLPLAVIKHSFLIDHYVTVLEFLDDQVVVGDPMRGKVAISREESERRWRFVRVVRRRGSSP